MRHVRTFMHRWSDSVSDKFAHVSITVYVFGIMLNRSSDISDAISDLGLFDTQIQSFFSYFHQTIDFRCWFADDIAPARIAHCAMIVDNRVNLNQISVTQDQVKSDLFCNCAMFLEILARKFFDFPTWNSWFDNLAKSDMHPGQNRTGFGHFLDFARWF